ncbi:hypothetical protein QYE76_001993 [Lolium multiflorum]|uniref:Retrotransposon gag domain-containing protein n=1 Tax=Lolium multiflorum TaxID=4521 RepID=A0AAD8VZV6_LOLMU|nr:hypothetical protein QYE76_001993 [Lolium multiflorum]
MAPRCGIQQLEAELKSTMDELSAQNNSMEGYTKQVLDSLQGMQTKIDEIQGSLAETTTTVVAGQQRMGDIANRLAAVELSARTALKPISVPLPGAGDGHGAEPNPMGSTRPPALGAATACPSASTTSFGSMDHRDPSLHRGDAPGIFSNQRSAPGTGTNPSPHARSTAQLNSPEHAHEHVTGFDTGGRESTPKMDFSKFKGENPMVWQQECETYFELYHVSDGLRTRYASLNFRGTAALWLRNVQAKDRVEDWGEMCRLVHDKFGKNKYMQYRRQMRALRQIGTVAEYIDKFEILRNQLLLYNPALDEAFFVDEFMHGLRDDIRIAIHLHCPKDLDSASLLALMQEEDMDSLKKKSPSRLILMSSPNSVLVIRLAVRNMAAKRNRGTKMMRRNQSKQNGKIVWIHLGLIGAPAYVSPVENVIVKYTSVQIKFLSTSLRN